MSHPYKKSYNYAILENIKNALENNNETFEIIELVDDGFDPVMRSEDLALYNKGEANDPLVVKYQEIINNADKLMFIFPIWWGGMPSILKGFIDKVLLKNFSFKIESGKVVGTLDFLKRTLVITTSSRTNNTLINKWGDPIGTTLVKSTFEVIGIDDMEWINFESISSSDLESREQFLEAIKKVVIN
jgi:putative NADPH-quinone reductase